MWILLSIQESVNLSALEHIIFLFINCGRITSSFTYRIKKKDMDETYNEIVKSSDNLEISIQLIDLN